MSVSEQTAELPGLDVPLRLEQAVKFGFPFGGMTVSGLRRERDRGNLHIERIAGKEFTTLRDIGEMRVKCRENLRVPASISVNGVAAKPSMSSSMGKTKSSLAAAEMIAEALKRPSASTSAKSTNQIGETVIQLRSE